MDRPAFTRESRIRIDRDGYFWDDGVRVEHSGLARAFGRWLAVDPESGRYILKNEVNWCFVTVDDAPLVVRRIAAGTGGELELALSDESREPLDATTLRIDEDEVPYCDVRGGALPARFSRQAAYDLLQAAEGTPDGPELRVGRELIRIPRVPRGEGAVRRGTGGRS
jgi:hypothetical protein